MQVQPAHGLTPSDLAAIAALEQRVVAHDGGRLKLEWGRLGSRSGERAQDVLAWSDDGRLVGFAGLYGPGPASIEIAGMVDPDARRRGLGGALLDAALALCVEAGDAAPLLIVARESAGGLALAAAHDGTLDHSEHALVLRGEPTDGVSDPAITLRPAQTDDVAEVMRLLSAGFGFAPADLGDRLVEPGVRTLVIERGGTVIGTMRVQDEGTVARVYGFAVDPAWRGQGIGRDALRRTCRQLREQGATEISLEVEVDNDQALGLYTSLGFTPVVTEDYWRLGT